MTESGRAPRKAESGLRAATILVFWSPLAVQWLLMSVEGPFLAAVIARMGDPAVNLAAYGVAFALAILVESPVIMLMSAATALVEDATSYRRLRNFTHTLNAGATAALLFILVPPVYAALMGTLLGLPQDVSDLVYVSLWLMLPWPGAIGYRRFLHGVLIRSGRTRLVAYGTVLRLVGMAGTAFALYLLSDLPGAWVGAISLTAGVVIEAVATRVMAREAIRELVEPRAGSADAGPAPSAPAAASRDTSADTEPAGSGHAQDPATGRPGTASHAAMGAAAVKSHAPGGEPDGYGAIARFYFPLALTSVIGLTVQPILTFFMGRALLPVESLAVFPVVHALSFLFRSTAFAYQETVIALAGRSFEHVRVLGRVGAGLGLAATGGFALVAFTPLAGVWFGTVSGLPPELVELATTAARLASPLPAVAMLLAFQHALLVKGRRTRPITASSALEVFVIAAFFAGLGWGVGMVGVAAAMVALVAGRVASNAALAGVALQVVRERARSHHARAEG